MRSVYGNRAFDTESRLHPLSVAALIVALVGIPVLGILVGAVAAILAGVALGQIAGNPRLRGTGMALAAMAIGIVDMILWVGILAIVLPRINVSDAIPVRQSISPSFRAPDRVPESIRRAMEANVFLMVDKPRRWPFMGTEIYSGSGVIVAKGPSGCTVLTNRHLVDPNYLARDCGAVVGAARIVACFHDGSRTEAHVCWIDDQGADMALVCAGIPPGDSVIQPLQKAPDVKIGDKVFVVGNPHELSWSYAEGIISGMRDLPGSSTKLKVLQLQVPINQGNSGGGLYSMDGTLIGLVSWTKSKAEAEGISFAIRYEDFVSRYLGKLNAQPSSGTVP